VDATRVGLLGAGRQAIETAGYCAEEGIETAFFVEEGPPEYERSTDQFGAPILTFSDNLEEFTGTYVLASVGMPVIRRRLVERWPGQDYLTLISGRAWVAPDSTLGTGCLIAPMAAVNRFCTLGDHVLVNVGAIISHDVTIGEFSTVSPGCSVGGLASIGKGSFLGIGCTVRDRISIGNGVLVAAGAVVVSDVEDGQVVMGVPATPQQGRNSPW
jgi:sugar O-acyltransferase (sialic acid O-acetyltransferase NeuD family)